MVFLNPCAVCSLFLRERALLILIYIAFISLGIPDSLLGAAWPAMHGDLGASLSLAPGERMSAVYRYPLYLPMAGFFLLFLALLLIRTRTEIRQRCR